jgi:hypothetical protein
MLFSPSTGSTYFEDLTYDNLPDDCISLSDEEYQAKMDAPHGTTFSIVKGVFTITPPPAPTDAQLLAQAKAAQIALVQSAYQVAITAPVSFTTAAGTTAQFAQDAASQANLERALLGSEKTGVWLANLWMNTSGQPVMPFTYADLQGLSAAMEAQEVPEYQELLVLIGQISAATTIAAVQAIVWPA